MPSATREINAHHDVRAALVAGSLLASVHKDVFERQHVRGSFFAGVLGTAGVVRASIEDAGFSTDAGSARFGGFGARLGVQLQLASFVAVRLHVQGLVIPHQLRLELRGHGDVLRASNVSADAGLGFLFLLDGQSR